jgi:hypothetical protein
MPRRNFTVGQEPDLPKETKSTEAGWKTGGRISLMRIIFRQCRSTALQKNSLLAIRYSPLAVVSPILST